MISFGLTLVLYLGSAMCNAASSGLSELQDALEDLGGEASDMSSGDEKEATKHSKENFTRSRGGASDMNQSDRPNASPSKKKIRFETRSVNDEKHREWEKTRQAFYTSSPYW